MFQCSLIDEAPPESFSHRCRISRHLVSLIWIVEGRVPVASDKVVGTNGIRHCRINVAQRFSENFLCSDAVECFLTSLRAAGSREDGQSPT